jgi:hypothetical protein
MDHEEPAGGQASRSFLGAICRARADKVQTFVFQESKKRPDGSAA